MNREVFCERYLGPEGVGYCLWFFSEQGFQSRIIVKERKLADALRSAWLDDLLFF